MPTDLPVNVPSVIGKRYSVELPDGTVFTNTDGYNTFDLADARLYARWVGGNVKPATTINVNTKEVRQALCCLTEGVTLNGLPARIAGWAQYDATIFQIETGWSAQFSWATVIRVVKRNGGRFTASLD
jgi:hypothetical protein